jgi:hypothetical protein
MARCWSSTRGGGDNGGAGLWLLTLLAVLVVIAAPTAAQPVSGSRGTVRPTRRELYFRGDTELPYWKALNYCRENDAELAIISSAEENEAASVGR